MCGEVLLGQLLALQVRQSGHNLFYRGRRAGAAQVRRQIPQELLQLGMASAEVADKIMVTWSHDGATIEYQGCKSANRIR